MDKGNLIYKTPKNQLISRILCFIIWITTIIFITFSPVALIIENENPYAISFLIFFLPFVSYLALRGILYPQFSIYENGVTEEQRSCIKRFFKIEGQFIPFSEIVRFKVPTDFLDTCQIIQKSYLFSLNMDYKQHLNDIEINEKLRTAFKIKGYPLSGDGIIFKIDDKLWEIDDGYRKYWIVERGTQLNIYVKSNKDVIYGTLKEYLNELIKILREKEIPEYEFLPEDQLKYFKKFLKKYKKLNPSDYAEQNNGIHTLEMIGSERIMKSMIKALKDENVTVRMTAIRKLGMIGDEKAIESLIDALKIKDNLVRYYALETLERMEENNAIVPLIEALKQRHKSSVWVALTLAGIGEKAVESLYEILKSEDKDVKYYAAYALTKIRSKNIKK